MHALLHYIHIIAHYFTTFGYHFKLIRKRRFCKDSFEFINKITIKYWRALICLDVNAVMWFLQQASGVTLLNTSSFSVYKQVLALQQSDENVSALIIFSEKNRT